MPRRLPSSRSHAPVALPRALLPFLRARRPLAPFPPPRSLDLVVMPVGRPCGRARREPPGRGSRLPRLAAGWCSARKKSRDATPRRKTEPLPSQHRLRNPRHPLRSSQIPAPQASLTTPARSSTHPHQASPSPRPLIAGIPAAGPLDAPRSTSTPTTPSGHALLQSAPETESR